MFSFVMLLLLSAANCEKLLSHNKKAYEMSPHGRGNREESRLVDTIKNDSMSVKSEFKGGKDVRVYVDLGQQADIKHVKMYAHFDQSLKHFIVNVYVVKTEPYWDAIKDKNRCAYHDGAQEKWEEFDGLAKALNLPCTRQGRYIIFRLTNVASIEAQLSLYELEVFGDLLPKSKFLLI